MHKSVYPVLHDVGKQEICSSLEPPIDNFYKIQWGGQGTVSK